MISESNKTLKNIELHLKNLNLTLQNVSLGNISYAQNLPLPNKDTGPGIERIRKPSTPNLIQGEMSSGKMMVIREMKSLFKQISNENSEFNIRQILKPLTEDELKQMRLDDEKLKQKEKEAIDNQIKRFKKEQEKLIKLSDLKKPK